jgi:hypothetical protein
MLDRLITVNDEICWTYRVIVIDDSFLIVEIRPRLTNYL